MNNNGTTELNEIFRGYQVAVVDCLGGQYTFPVPTAPKITQKLVATTVVGISDHLLPKGYVLGNGKMGWLGMYSTNREHSQSGKDH